MRRRPLANAAPGPRVRIAAEDDPKRTSTMIKLPHPIREFPRRPAREGEGNAWGSQWRYLPRRVRGLVSSAGHLRKLED